MAAKKPEQFSEFPPRQRKALQQVIDSVREMLPGAELTTAWGMPTLRIDGEIVLSVQGFQRHNSLFPGGGVTAALTSILAGYEVTKGTVHFPVDVALPKKVLRAIVRARIEEINAVYPKKSGVFKEFYDNGYLKATGRYRNGELTGSWQWFRRDGSPLRSGSFRAGQQVGEWITYDRHGQVYRRTSF